MTSESSFPQRLTEIDDLTRPDHRYLVASDICHFIGEYTARRGFACSATNSLILDFKKPVDRSGLPEWRYKEEAVATAAAVFRRAVHPDVLNRLVFVPVPPSKAREDARYDDRLVRMLQAVRPQRPLDVRELIVQTHSTEAAHLRAVRPKPEEIAASYRIDPARAAPAPGVVAAVDDLLTTGAHFRAAATVLSARFPDIDVVGLFIARRVPGTTEPEALDEAASSLAGRRA